MKFYLYQMLEIYAITIVISMGVAFLIIGLNKALFFFEDLHKKHTENSSKNSNGQA